VAGSDFPVCIGPITYIGAEEVQRDIENLQLASQESRPAEAFMTAALVLQLDAPDLVIESHRKFQDLSTDEFLAIVALHIEAINQAIAGLPRQQIRLHGCWGNGPRPHTTDIPLRDIIHLCCVRGSEPCPSRPAIHATSTSGVCSKASSYRMTGALVNLKGDFTKVTWTDEMDPHFARAWSEFTRGASARCPFLTRSVVKGLA